MNDEANSSTSGNSDSTALDQALIERLLDDAGVSWPDLTAVAVTGSTNTDLSIAFEAGRATDGSVIAAGSQTAGRGRLGRHWESPEGGSLSWSILLKLPESQLAFAPIVVGIAVARALTAETGQRIDLKWPNDVQLGGRKVAGLLSERVQDVVVVGCGINVGVSSSELAAPSATSLADHGCERGREEILVSCLIHLSRLLEQWRERSYSPVGSRLLDAYRRVCGTIGQTVAVELPGGRKIEGLARDVDDHGRLLVDTADGMQVIDAGDVTHVRPSA